MPRAGESVALRSAQLRAAFLHVERRATRPERVVLVGDRRAEDRHDAVAQHLVDRALVGVHGVHHHLLERIEQRAHFFRIEVLHEVGRPLDVGEQDGHLLALAFDRGAGAQDLLGEQRGRVPGGGCPGLRLGRLLHGLRRLILERSDHPEQALARPHGKAELLQIRLFEIVQIAGLDLLGFERVGILA